LNQYQNTMQKVLGEIEKNLEYVDIEDLIQLSGYSYYHFHRIFLGFTGESLKRYIRRQRLQNSAYKLQFINESITHIAMQAGYQTASSYNKAFREMFHCAPSEFVKEFKIKKDIKMIEPIKTTDIAPIEVYTLRHVGDYFKTDETWNKLVEYVWKNNLKTADTKFYGIGYDDPDVVETSKLRYDACITKTIEIKPDNGIELKQIAGGMYAIFLHKGSYEKLIETYTSIYGSWIQNNNIELRDEPPIEQYVTMDVKEDDLVTEIWIPVK